MQGKNNVQKFENSRREGRKQVRNEKQFKGDKRNKPVRKNDRWNEEY